MTAALTPVGSLIATVVRPVGGSPSTVRHLARVRHYYGPSGDLIHVVPICGAAPGQAVSDDDAPGRGAPRDCGRCARIAPVHTALDGIEGHVPRYTARRLGTRWGSNTTSYGTTVTCSCGWQTFTNEKSPSAGGEVAMRRQFLIHLDSLDNREGTP